MVGKSGDVPEDGDEDAPVISPREGLQERLRKARERRKRRTSGDVVPGGEAAATAMPETVMAGSPQNEASVGIPGVSDEAGGGISAQQEVEDVKTSLAKKRALLQQQRKQRKMEADRMLARRQYGRTGSSSKFDPAVTPTEGDREGRQPRLFDEFNDDDDEEEGGYGSAAGGKRDGVRVVLVAPIRSPAMPAAPVGAAGRCCRGGSRAESQAATKGEGAADTTGDCGDGGDETSNRPPPVLASGWARAEGSGRVRWQAHGGSEAEKREEEEFERRDAAMSARASAAAATREEGREHVQDRGKIGESGTERARRTWIAARENDERKRLLKEEEGLAVKHLPKAAPELMRRGGFQDRLLRDAVFARAEEEERTMWRDLQGRGDAGDIGGVIDSKNIYEDVDNRQIPRRRAPSATVLSLGRGPSQAADFFSAHGAPSILEDPLEPLPMRVERPPADEDYPLPAYLEASVRRPTTGIGPEARLAGLDDRTELRIIVSRVAFHDHPLFTEEDRLSASLRMLFGRYRAKIEAGGELYLRRRLSASLSTLLRLRAHVDGTDMPVSSPASTTGAASKVRRVMNAAGISTVPKRTRERAGWLLRDALTALALVLAEREEMSRLEHAMGAAWESLEEDRMERGVSSTSTRLVSREVEEHDDEEMAAAPLADSETGTASGLAEEDHGLFSPSGEGVGREGRGASFNEQLIHLENLSAWLSELNDANAIPPPAAENSGDAALVAESAAKPAAQRRLAGKRDTAEGRRRREERKKIEQVILQCKTSLASAAEAKVASNEGNGGGDGKETGSFVLRLSNDGVVTSDAGCGWAEKARRENARALRFRAAVFVNGSKVSTTGAVPLEWPDFACSFNHLVRLRLVRRPESVMVSIYCCNGVDWWPDQEVASVWVPVPGGSSHDHHMGESSGVGPQTTHAFAPRTQWTQFAAKQAMATSGTFAGRRTCGSILAGTEWATSRNGVEDMSGGGANPEGIDASAPTLPIRGATESSHLTLMELFLALWTAEGRTKLRAKPLLGLRFSHYGGPVGRGNGRGFEVNSGGGDGGGRVGERDICRDIPDFAREADFLRLLPRGADVDPNDPRHGNVMRMRGLLAALGLGRRDSSVVAQAMAPGGGGPVLAKFGGISAGPGGGSRHGEDDADTGVFRASQEQQVLVFSGKRLAKGFAAAPGRGGVNSGSGVFHKFAYNNHHRWKEPLRHTLIRLRSQKPALFGNRPIPVREEDIRRDDTFTAILAQEAIARAHRHDSSGGHGSLLVDGDVDVELDTDIQKKRMAVDQGRVMDFVQRVRDSHTAQARRQALKRVTYESVVQEEAVPQLGIALGGESFFPKRKRALCPEPKERSAATVQLDECRLLLQIISARNVPVRGTEEVAAPSSPVPPTRRQQEQRQHLQPEQSQRQQQQPLLAGGADGGGVVNTLAEDDDDFEEERVIRHKGTLSSFVEVQFQDTRKRTNVYEGLTPLWKESLDLTFTPPMADFSPANLAQVNEMIIISLFDEVEFDDRGSGGYLETEPAIRREKRFLGSAVLPFQTVYQAGRVEGALRLDVPAVNLGYDQVHSGGAGIDPVDGASIMQEEEGPAAEGEEVGVSLTTGPGDPASPAALVQKADRSTYVRVLATLDPIPIVLAKERVPGTNHEPPGLVSAGIRWMKKIKDATKIPEGVLTVQLFVPDMFGNDTLVTRYLCPQEPPAGLNTVYKCAHYVRLLPFLEDWQIFEGVDDMWCTSQQFLDILAGDEEEHAVLLHNYILHLIMLKEGTPGSNRRPPGRTGLRTEVYIIIGRAVPEGDTIYVMVQELSRFGEPRTTAIWKPSSGDGFDARDTRCPLVDIACVVSQENVWACLRRNIRPCDLNLDLLDAKTWVPFFSSQNNPAPAQGYTSVQEDITYRPTQQSFVYEVEDLIRETLKREIRRWRSKRSHTAFNADVSNRLAELLPLLERQALVGGTKIGKDEHRRRLENTMRSREIAGFPLHSGFVDVDSIVQMVRATGIHEARHPEVQFALAVQAFAYPHNVLSVWVYIASITPR